VHTKSWAGKLNTQEVPKSGRGPLFLHCKGGYRGHLALRILVENAFTVRSESLERSRAGACLFLSLLLLGD
jgi:hypothetical protein